MPLTILQNAQARRSPSTPQPKTPDPAATTTPKAPKLVTEAIRAARAERSNPISARATANVYDGANYVGTGRDEIAGSGANAAKNAQKGLDYLANRFGRDGLDNRGSSVDVVINDVSKDANGEEQFLGNGGYYTMQLENGSLHEGLRFGRGTSYQSHRGLVEHTEMYNADDIVVHELTHGLIKKSSGHAGGSADEAGATNEALADVMGAAATRDWTIGEGMYTANSSYRSLRNIANPDDPTSVHGLYRHKQEYDNEFAQQGSVSEHHAAGILSTALQRTQAAIGGEAGWRTVEQIAYDTISKNRLGDMSFSAVANGLRSTAGELYGEDSRRYSVLDSELSRNGI